ncbi:MAG: hypothetical protein RLZZ381_1907 [Cyanobacteriota bacterium]|jgi:hypothetical protein
MKNILRFSTALILVPKPFSMPKNTHVNLNQDSILEEKIKVVETLKQDDCTASEDVDYVPNIGFEAEDIKCNDAQKYEIFLDKNFSFTFKREDLN